MATINFLIGLKRQLGDADNDVRRHLENLTAAQRLHSEASARQEALQIAIETYERTMPPPEKIEESEYDDEE